MNWFNTLFTKFGFKSKSPSDDKIQDKVDLNEIQNKIDLDKMKKLTAALQKSALFNNFPEADLYSIARYFQQTNFTSNTTFIHEGDISTDFFVLIEGEADVLKKEKTGIRQHKIATLKQGDVLGELGLVDQQLRSASVVTTAPSVIFSIPIATLKSELQKNPRLASQAYLNLTQQLSTRLRNVNEVTVDALQNKLDEMEKRVSMGRFMVYILLMIFSYVFSFKILLSLAKGSPSVTLLNIPIIIFLVILSFSLMLHSGYPLSTYGLTLKNAGRSMFVAVLYTIPIIMFITFFKFLAIRYLPSFSGYLLFDNPFTNAHSSSMSLKIYLLIAIAYAIDVPFQEIIVRGSLQGSLQLFLYGPYKVFIAILLSTLAFMMMHLHLEGALAVGIFPLSLFWGWLYSRQGNVIGVSVSHILIGVWVTSILGGGPWLSLPH